MSIATSRVYDANGGVIADLHGEINRDTIALDEIPLAVRDAAVAVEDERFWKHQGVDIRSIVRAIASNVRHRGAGAELQGGSTISQQLAKNIYFPRPERTLSRKIAEARVTYELERKYTKARILEMYLNTIYLGRGVYGIETAANSYFGKSASRLTLTEGAFLAGLIHEPARYEWSPTDPPQRRSERIGDARDRRNYVLDRMRILHFISLEEAERAKRAPLDVKPATEKRWTHPYFVDYVLRELGVLRNSKTQPLDPRFDFLGTTFDERSRNVYRGGLRIYTALDPRAQDAAEKAISQVIPKELDRLSAALVAVEPATGYVRALVGGRDYYPNCEGSAETQPRACLLSRLNLALGNNGGGSGRQPGSSFKPFVLTAALERGIPLYQSYDSSPFSYSYTGGTWNVGNYEGEGGGSRTLIDATAHSINAVYAHLEIDGVGDGNGMAGAERVAGVARRMGVGLPTRAQLKERCGPNYEKQDNCFPADETPAIALGAKEVAPLDMASAYATLANDGIRVQPTAIVRITDSRGRVLYRQRPDRGRVIPSGVARGVTYALQQVIESGTGTAADIGRPAAGKTGTSQEWRDAWFAGYVPQLAATVWVGNPIPVPGVGNESMTEANGYPFRVVGGTYPARIWHEFMGPTLEGVPVVGFRDPPEQLFSGNGLVAPPTPTPLETATATAVASPTAEPQRVPDVVGLSFGDADQRLRNRGFVPNNQRGCDPRHRADLHQVFAQNPPGGSEAPAGSTVTVLYQAGHCD